MIMIIIKIKCQGIIFLVGISCGRAENVMDPHTTGPGSRPGGYGTLSNVLLTDNHHRSIIKMLVRWCVCGRSGNFVQSTTAINRHLRIVNSDVEKPR